MPGDSTADRRLEGAGGHWPAPRVSDDGEDHRTSVKVWLTYEGGAVVSDEGGIPETDSRFIKE